MIGHLFALSIESVVQLTGRNGPHDSIGTFILQECRQQTRRRLFWMRKHELRSALLVRGADVPVELTSLSFDSGIASARVVCREGLLAL